MFGGFELCGLCSGLVLQFSYVAVLLLIYSHDLLPLLGCFLVGAGVVAAVVVAAVVFAAVVALITAVVAFIAVGAVVANVAVVAVVASVANVTASRSLRFQYVKVSTFTAAAISARASAVGLKYISAPQTSVIGHWTAVHYAMVTEA